MMIIIENSRAKQCAQCKALDVYERLVILHAFTGSVGNGIIKKTGFAFNNINKEFKR